MAFKHVVDCDQDWVRQLSGVEYVRGLLKGSLASVNICIGDGYSTTRAR